MWYSPEMEGASWETSPVSRGYRSASVEPVLPVPVMLIMQGTLTCLEIVLFGLQTMLLVMIGPFALVSAPVVVVIDGSRHNRHDRNRLRVHLHRAQRQNRRNR